MEIVHVGHPLFDQRRLPGLPSVPAPATRRNRCTPSHATWFPWPFPSRPALGQPRRLAHPVAEVEEFRPADLAVPHDFELGDLRRMDRKTAFDSFAADDAADGEQLARSRPRRAMTTPLKIWMRSLSPSRMRVWTLTVSPIAKASGSARRLEASTCLRMAVFWQA